MKSGILALLLLPAAVSAGETKAKSLDGSRVAVVGFRATGVDEVTVDNLTEVFTTEAGKVPGWKIIGTSEIRDLVGYQAQQNMLGCDDAACVSDLAGALGVDLLIAGSVGKVGDTFVVNVRIIDVKSVETKHRVGSTIAGRVDTLLPYVRLAAWQILGVRPPDDVVAANESAQAAAPVPKEEPKKEEVATAPGPKTVQAQSSWEPLARKIATGVAAIGFIGGGALGGYSYWRGSQVGEAKPAQDGIAVYEGTQKNAQTSADFKTYAMIGGIVGVGGAIAAIVFRILEPPTTMVVVQPSANGVSISF